MSTITPTVGRKVWFYDSPPLGEQHHEMSDKQPFDATIIYVWNEGMVNLDVTGHDGARFIATSVPLRSPSDSDCHNGFARFATWMPYQMGQAAKAEADAGKPSDIDVNKLGHVAAGIAADRDRIERIARVCHEANRAYCESLGDYSQPDWVDAPAWQRESARMGVDLHLSGDFGPEASHISWMQQKLADGWTYGPVKNPELKQHPCMVPFSELPREQQAKDFIFRAIVHALRAS